MKHFFTLFMAFMVSSFVVWGQQSTGQAPVFKSKVEIVQLDVSVLDKHRQPIKGLTANDFTILEDNKPQKIVAFSTFDLEDASAPATGWMRDVAPDVTSNDLKPQARLWVIILDDALIPMEPGAAKASKDIANSIIDNLAPADLAAVVFTGDNRQTQNFTGDKTKLRAALEKFRPGLAGYRFGLDTTPPLSTPRNGAAAPINGDARAYPPPDDMDITFYQSSVRTLETLADYLATIPNRRKAIFWVSPGVPVDLTGAVPADRDGNARIPAPICLQGDPGLCQTGRGVWAAHFPAAMMVDLNNRTQRIFQNAQRANVTIYPVDPTGMDGMRSYLTMRLGQENTQFSLQKATIDRDYLVSAAANTGGRAIVNINEFGPEIGEVFDENKSYYLLAIEPLNPAADGKLHKLQVKVDRPDVEVRTRSGYYAPEAETKEDKKIAKSKMTPEAIALTKSMSGILPASGMPLTASAAAFAVPGQKLSTVTVALSVTQPIPQLTAQGPVVETTQLLTSAYTPEGDPRGAQTHVAKVTLRGGSKGVAGYDVLARIDLPPGRYELRLAAHNTTAEKDGSVFVDVTVPDYRKLPFSATPIVFAEEPGPVAAPKGLLFPLLPLVPTAEREFARGAMVTAFMRLYQTGQQAEPASLTFTIRNAADKILLRGTKPVGLEEFVQVDKLATPPMRSADVDFNLPLSVLEPGPHLLTIEATLGTTTIRRDVRFDVK